MVTRVVEFSPTSNAAAHLVQVIEETALRIVKAQAGCILACVQMRGQIVIGVSVWKSDSDAERYSRECYPDIVTMLRPFLKSNPKVYTSDLRMQPLAPEQVRRVTKSNPYALFRNRRTAT